MSTVYVQFTDSTETVIALVFGAPPDVENAGTVDTSDARYATFYNSLPSFLTEYLPKPDSDTSSTTS